MPTVSTRRVSAVAVTIAAMVIVVAGLKLAEPLLAPLLLAALITATAAPIAAWLSARGLPAALGAAVALLAGVGFLLGFGILIAYAADEVRVQLPAYWSRAHEGATVVAAKLTRLGLHTSSESVGALLDPGRLMGVLGSTLSTAADMMSHVFVMALLVFFALAEIAGLGDKMRCILPASSRGLERIEGAVREVQKYLVVKTATSLIAAIVIGAWLKIFKVDFAVLLAVIVFLLHYIPNIGPLIATVPGVTVALFQHGPGTAIAVGIGYFVVHGLVGNVLEPKVMGRTLGLSPLVVLLAMVFWGWLWGPIGALLSVPLTMIAKIAFENTDELRWIAVLLGPTDACPVPQGRARLLPLVRPPAPVGLGAGDGLRSAARRGLPSHARALPRDAGAHAAVRSRRDHGRARR